MEHLVALVKAFVPGSVAFLLLAVGAGMAFLYVPRFAGWARRWLVFVVLLYVVLATPVVSEWLERGLHPRYPRIERPDDARGATAIVVLGNGAVAYEYESGAVHAPTRRTAMNVLEGTRVHRMLPRARLIVSGGSPTGSDGRTEAVIMRDILTGLGVAPAVIVMEGTSRNTHEQSVRVADLLRPGERVVLVTTPIHMRRALALFESRGFHVTPSPARIEYVPHGDVWHRRLAPSTGALRASELTIYERLAFVLGWARDWSAGKDVAE